ncbi:MAG: hypothetical protein NTX49_00910, partial [Chlamydiae bacterium]|nr:hypothetical protein [Chlamydiota bacterium]
CKNYRFWAAAHDLDFVDWAKSLRLRLITVSYCRFYGKALVARENRATKVSLDTDAFSALFLGMSCS